uniref:Chitin-binding type-2 domain-containing protein n=1 Tax=Timema genevievae TaxID=629358 RepID=A0A7R9K3I4_TIMGE|nr:unnamed protein product [Timema genevievae]
MNNGRECNHGPPGQSTAPSLPKEVVVLARGPGNGCVGSSIRVPTRSPVPPVSRKTSAMIGLKSHLPLAVLCACLGECTAAILFSQYHQPGTFWQPLSNGSEEECTSKLGESWRQWVPDTGIRDTYIGIRDTYTGIRDTYTGIRDKYIGIRNKYTDKGHIHGPPGYNNLYNSPLKKIPSTLSKFEKLGCRDTSTGPGGIKLGFRDTSTGPGGIELGCRDTSTGPGGIELGCRDTSTGPGGLELGCRDTSTGPGGIELYVGTLAQEQVGAGGIELDVGTLAQDQVVLELGCRDTSTGPGGIELYVGTLAQEQVGLALCQSSTRKQHSTRKQQPRTTTLSPEDDADTTDQCPEPNGYFADAFQCDKYYECLDGAITEKLCPDGMVFNDFSSEYEKCDLPFNIDCSQRPERQEPQPTLNCPRKNGYFAHQDVDICDKFYFCVDGKFNMITCPDGLVYNDKTGICTWPDEAKKKGCSSKGTTSSTSPVFVILWCPVPVVLSSPVFVILWSPVFVILLSCFCHPVESCPCHSVKSCLCHPVESCPFHSVVSCPCHPVKSCPCQPVVSCSCNPVVSCPCHPIESCPCQHVVSCSCNPVLSCPCLQSSTMYTDVFNFSCPKVDMAEAGTHPRYADPEDCQFFYVCINGEIPRRSGCKMGQVFNEVKGTCDWPRNVPECVDWYKGILTDEQLAALENPPAKPKSSASYKTRNGGRKRPTEEQDK